MLRGTLSDICVRYSRVISRLVRGLDVQTSCGPRPDLQECLSPFTGRDSAPCQVRVGPQAPHAEPDTSWHRGSAGLDHQFPPARGHGPEGKTPRHYHSSKDLSDFNLKRSKLCCAVHAAWIHAYRTVTGTNRLLPNPFVILTINYLQFLNGRNWPLSDHRPRVANDTFRPF